MLNKLYIYLQYLLPQHLLSSLMGSLAESRVHWFKNFLIGLFIKLYPVNMKEAEIEDPFAYSSFNDFFTRHLKRSVRPIAESPNAIISPVDGCVSQCGIINQGQILQAKNFYFDLKHLLVDDRRANDFSGGNFATLYLAPKDYHRVHMPVTGKLIKTIYVPGKLFSVNKITSELVPGLYSRNERLITFFDTEFGPMVVILVAAMIVGSIQTVWMQKPLRAKKILSEDHQNMTLTKGEELGLFKMGSTVILLFEKDKISWQPNFSANSVIKLGQIIGEKRSLSLD